MIAWLPGFLGVTAAIISVIFKRDVLGVWLAVGGVVAHMQWSSPELRFRAVTVSFYSVAFLALYSLPVPLNRVLFTGGMTAPERDAFIAHLLALAGLIFGTALPVPTSSVSGAERERWSYVALRGGGKKTLVAGVVASLGLAASTVGLGSYLAAGYTGRSVIKQSFGPIEIGLYFVVVGLFALWDAELSGLATRRRLFTVALSSCAFVIASIGLGIRRPAFYLIGGVFIIFAMRRRSLRRRHIVALGLTGLFLFGTFSNYRQVLSDSGARAARQFVAENASWRWLDLSEGELGAPFSATVFAIETDVDAQPFESYVQSIPNAVPSTFFDVTTTLSEQYTVLATSDRFRSMGGNLGFSPVGEAYLNFGFAGPLFLFTALGYILRRVESATLVRGHHLTIICAAVVLAWWPFFLRLDFASFLKGFIYTAALPVAVLYVVVEMHSTRSVRTSPPVPMSAPPGKAHQLTNRS